FDRIQPRGRNRYSPARFDVTWVHDVSTHVVWSARQVTWRGGHEDVRIDAFNTAPPGFGAKLPRARFLQTLLRSLAVSLGPRLPTVSGTRRGFRARVERRIAFRRRECLR